LLPLALFAVGHWALGAIPLLRRAGWPRTVRWMLALLLALAGAGMARFPG
jgi:hypothetical protein